MKTSKKWLIEWRDPVGFLVSGNHFRTHFRHSTTGNRTGSEANQGWTESQGVWSFNVTETDGLGFENRGDAPSQNVLPSVDFHDSKMNSMI